MMPFRSDSTRKGQPILGDEDAQYSTRENAEFQKHGRMDVPLADTEIIVVSAKDSFRRMAKTLPTSEDAVLEIGCSTGAATRQLAATGACVVAVDKSPECVDALQEELRECQDVVVACLDGRNIPGLAGLMPSPTIIFIDIGGDAILDMVALQLRLCLRAFQPRLVVVRSFELATLASLIGQVEPPPLSGLHPPEQPLGRDRLSNLLDLSCSTSTDTRCFAARRLGTLHSARACDRLREMMDDPHPKVRRAAERACEALAAEFDSGAGENGPDL